MKRIEKEKRMVEVEVEVPVEYEGSEFADAMGKEVALFGMVYIYGGKLVGENDHYVILEDAGIIYETGAFNSKTWKDFQKVPASNLKVRKPAIESWFVVSR